MRACVADPALVRGDPQQVLRDQEAQQLDIVQSRLPPRVMSAGKPDSRQLPVIPMDIGCD
jgi:hypothetical protein